MYARCVRPVSMHPHVCWMLTRARSTSVASEHLLLTQVASPGLVTPDTSSRTTTPACNQLMDRPTRVSRVVQLWNPLTPVSERLGARARRHLRQSVFPDGG